MSRIAVLGGTGMAGHVVFAYLEEKGHDVYVTSRSAKEGLRSKPVDATDFASLDIWLRGIAPDVIVNCIGVLPKQADAFPDIAIQLNAALPQWLCRSYRDTPVKIIHLSTDCVFSGKRGGYTESDEPDGPTIYDRSKALGEIANDKDLTFRMSIIGPDNHEEGTGLFHWFMGQSGEIRGYTNAIWNGVTTIHLAEAISAAIEQKLSGLYQLAPKEPIDKYHLLLLFQQEFLKKDIRVVPFDGFKADKSLINTRTDFKFGLKPYPVQIKEMKAWIDAHPSFYGTRYYKDHMPC